MKWWKLSGLIDWREVAAKVFGVVASSVVLGLCLFILAGFLWLCLSLPWGGA